MKKRKYNNFKGYLAEVIAAIFLMLKGYKILARRYRVKAGEIDIIALRGKRIAFVEVKLRSDIEVAMSALTWDQRNRILNASAYWLNKNKYYKRFNIGYDYIALVPWRFPLHKNHHFRDYRK